LARSLLQLAWAWLTELELGLRSS